MYKYFTLSLIFLCSIFYAFTSKKDSRVYELRVYYCLPNKLPDLMNRFRSHTTKLFEKHGMENVGYWTPIQNDSNALYYILAYPNRAARDLSWKNFMDDKEWQKVMTDSEINGKIIKRISSTFMQTTDFSPKVKSSKKANRVFELRTYYCNEGKLPTLLERFRNHTLKLFEKHGMKNFPYFTTIEENSSIQPKLIYLLSHKSEAEGKKSFETFVKDPKWIKARDDSEKNGKIIEKIESIYMIGTDFSTIK